MLFTMKRWLRAHGIDLFSHPDNAPGTCPGCGRPNDVWQDTAIADGYLVTRLWRGCSAVRRAMSLHDIAEMNRHYAKWTMVSRAPLVDTGLTIERPDDPDTVKAVKS